MRTVIKGSNTAFPAEALADRLQQMNRPIRFTEEDIDDLLTVSYGQKQAFLVLSLLYPWVDYRNAFHLDHIHPQSGFTSRKLRQAGVPEADIEFCLTHYDEIPNLQILANIPNIEKSGIPFGKWLAGLFTSKKARTEYCERQYIPDVNLDMAGFRQFFEARAKLMRADLVKVLQPPTVPT